MHTAELRHAIYLVLTLVATAIVTAKVVGVENVFEPSRYESPTPDGFNADRIDAPTRDWPQQRPQPVPMFGSNDRSRWATVRALVDHGTFAVGHRSDYNDPATDSGIIFEDGWSSIDKVLQPDTHIYFSSKPPLFAVLVAGEYWVLKNAFGLEIVRDRWPVIMIVLLTVNVLPFFISLVLLAKLIELHGTTDFGRLIAFATAALGTFLITFSNTLNNHTPAACCVVFAIYPLLRSAAAPSGLALFVSGFFAAFAATFDLPAAAFAGAVLLVTMIRVQARVFWMMLGMLIPTIAFFVANYAAIGQWLPAYGEFGSPWYNYPGSHWAKLQFATPTNHIPGIDYARETRLVYLFHCLLGHHGWFSLTPIWLVGMLGCIVTFRAAIARLKSSDTLSYEVFVQMAGVLFLVLVVFFVFIQRTNNYGGGTSGLRWFFWLIPLAVLATLAGADRLAQLKWARVLMAVMLGVSTLSAFYPAWNPWRSPWLMVLMERLEWVNYERR